MNFRVRNRLVPGVWIELMREMRYNSLGLFLGKDLRLLYIIPAKNPQTFAFPLSSNY